MAPQKKYVCAFCARAFSRSEHKQRHERSHTNEKPFHCQYCTSAFVRRDLLQRHCRTVHNVNMVPNGNNKRKLSNQAVSSPASPEEDKEDHTSPSLSIPLELNPQLNPQLQLPLQLQLRLQLNLHLPHLHPTTLTSSLIPPLQFVNTNEQQYQKTAASVAHTNLSSSSPKSGPLAATPLTPATTSNTSPSSTSTELEKKIVQSLSLSKKLTIAISNFEKISILQSRDLHRIGYIGNNLNTIIQSSNLNLSKPVDDYLLGWNILNKFKLPILENISNEVDEFIDTFSNLSSMTFISKLYSKFNEYSNDLNFSAVDNKKILNIECKICLLFATLSIGAAIFNNDHDCVQLFMKSWNLLLTNLIPRLNDSTKNIDEMNTQDQTQQQLYHYPIIKDQIQILKNLFTLAYISFNLDQSLKDLSANSLNGDLIFNYLDEISFIIMSHLEDNKIMKNSSRSSSASSIISTMIDSPDNTTTTVDAGTANNNTPNLIVSGSDHSIIDDNLNLFWSIYILLSNYFMINNHPPPKIYKYLLNKPLDESSTNSLANIMENLSKSTITTESDFNNEIISITLSNELQCFIHYNHMMVYELKSILHNSIIFTNKSLNQQQQNQDNQFQLVQTTLFNDDSYIFEMFKRKMIVNAPSKYQGLLNNYIFNPAHNFNWNLLYASLKEFNVENYTLLDNVDASIYSKFKLNDFFQRFFHDFDIKPAVELEIANNDQFKKDQYLQFIKYFLPFFTKSGIDPDSMEMDNDDQIEISASLSKRVGEELIINNNLGITCLPILFNYQFIKIHPGLMKWNKQSKLNNFERKRFNYLLMEWYLTILKLIIGLKNDSDVYVKRRGHQHYRSHLQDSLESITQAPPPRERKINNNEYSLSNNYIFQCLVYIIKEVGGKVKLPNGSYIQLRDFEENLKFEADEFKITDEIIYCIVKNLENILEEWIGLINVNSLDILKSNGFKNMQKFVNDYIISQLNLGGESNEGKYYNIPHRNLENMGRPMENYVFDQKQQQYQNLQQHQNSLQAQQVHHQQQSLQHAQQQHTQSIPQYHGHQIPPQPQPQSQSQSSQSQSQAPPAQPQQKPQVSFQHTLIPIMHQVVPHIPYSHLLPSQPHSQQPAISFPSLYSLFQTSSQNLQQMQLQPQPQLQTEFKDVVLPPILPPLSNKDQHEFHNQHRHQHKHHLHHQAYQFPERQEGVNK